jgi:hypothetical protein
VQAKPTCDVSSRADRGTRVGSWRAAARRRTAGTGSEFTEMKQDIDRALTPPIRTSRYALISGDEDWL